MDQMKLKIKVMGMIDMIKGSKEIKNNIDYEALKRIYENLNNDHTKETSEVETINSALSFFDWASNSY